MEDQVSAAVYGRMLKAEMVRQKVTIGRLSAASGVAYSYVHQARSGRTVPRLATSEKIAEALMAPALHEYVVKARTSECPVCGQPFVINHKNYHRKQTCGPTCSATARMRRERAKLAPVKERRIVIAERRIAVYQKAVDAYCRGCEPMGLCQPADCPLRGVSPLPLSREAAA